jgi:hypothetical protein
MLNNLQIFFQDPNNRNFFIGIAIIIGLCYVYFGEDIESKFKRLGYLLAIVAFLFLGVALVHTLG